MWVPLCELVPLFCRLQECIECKECQEYKKRAASGALFTTPQPWILNLTPHFPNTDFPANLLPCQHQKSKLSSPTQIPAGSAPLASSTLTYVPSPLLPPATSTLHPQPVAGTKATAGTGGLAGAEGKQPADAAGNIAFRGEAACRRRVQRGSSLPTLLATSLLVPLPYTLNTKPRTLGCKSFNPSSLGLVSHTPDSVCQFSTGVPPCCPLQPRILNHPLIPYTPTLHQVPRPRPPRRARSATVLVAS